MLSSINVRRIGSVVAVPLFNVVRQTPIASNNAELLAMLDSLTADGWQRNSVVKVRPILSADEQEFVNKFREGEFAAYQAALSKLSAKELRIATVDERLAVWNAIFRNESGELLPITAVMTDGHQRISKVVEASIRRLYPHTEDDKGNVTKDHLPAIGEAITDFPYELIPLEVAKDPIALLQVQYSANASRDLTTQELSDYDKFRVAFKFMEAGRPELLRRASLFNTSFGQRASLIYRLNARFPESGFIDAILASEGKSAEERKTDRTILPPNYLRLEHLNAAWKRSGVLPGEGESVDIKIAGERKQYEPTDSWGDILRDHIDAVRFPNEGPKAATVKEIKALAETQGVALLNRAASFAEDATDEKRALLVACLTPVKPLLACLDALERLNKDCHNKTVAILSAMAETALKDEKKRQEGEKVAADKVAADKVAADKVAADKVAADKVAADKVAADKVAADKVAADKATVSHKDKKTANRPAGKGTRAK